MKYRKLEIGEVIQEGDEVRVDERWAKVMSFGIGDKVAIRGFFRRPMLTPEQTANLFRENLAELMEECGVGDISFDVYENITYSMGNRSDILGYALVTPKSLRESITSPTQGATEES